MTVSFTTPSPPLVSLLTLPHFLSPLAWGERKCGSGTEELYLRRSDCGFDTLVRTKTV